MNVVSISGVSLSVDTRDGEELVSAVADLRHVRRDDDLCRTFSLRALWSAVDSTPLANNSVIFLVTDGRPRDPQAWRIILDRAKKKLTTVGWEAFFFISPHTGPNNRESWIPRLGQLRT